jgi:hypothetical protein
MLQLIPLGVNDKLLGLSGVLPSSSTLSAGQIYTFTFDHGRIFEYNSDSWVLSELRKRLSHMGDILSAKRPLFSSNWVITVIPLKDASLNNWINSFINAWRDMGYNKLKFLTAEGGESTSIPGGLPQLTREAVQVVTEPVKEISKSILLPTGIILGAGLLIYLLVIKGGRS